MRKLRDFFAVYRLYRRAAHSRMYCVRIAWDIAAHKTPF